ncbi:hypothetical protein C8R43DRAFT_964663 [Mycena crocata]|nr:hypothetical protein C8R43DRAFT_964663 [Mycena crocata]
MPAIPTPLPASPLPPTAGYLGLNVSPAVGLASFIGSVVVVSGGYFCALYVSDLLKARKAKKADEEKSVNGAVVRAQLPEKTVTGAGVVTIKQAYAAAALATARANLPITTGKRVPQPVRPSIKFHLQKGVFRSLLLAHPQFMEPVRFGTRANAKSHGASPLREITNAPADTPVLAYVTAPKANPVSAQSFIAVALASFVARSYHDCDNGVDFCSDYSDDEDEVVVDSKDTVGELAPSRSAETIAVYTDLQAIFNAVPLACATSSTSTSTPVSIKSTAIKGALGSVTGTPPPVLGPSRLGNVQRVDYRTYKRPSAFREYREKKDKENAIMLGSSIRLPPRAYLYKIAPAVL